jgi:hypothetical protein
MEAQLGDRRKNAISCLGADLDAAGGGRQDPGDGALGDTRRTSDIVHRDLATGHAGHAPRPISNKAIVCGIIREAVATVKLARVGVAVVLRHRSKPDRRFASSGWRWRSPGDDVEDMPMLRAEKRIPVLVLLVECQGLESLDEPAHGLGVDELHALPSRP